MSLLDPITLNCIQFPARTMLCTHFSVCEAASLIQLKECPICGRHFQSNEIYVDKFLRMVIEQNQNLKLIRINLDTGCYTTEQGDEKSQQEYSFD